MYRVFGYDDLCCEFDVNFDSFVKMVNYVSYYMGMAVVFIERNGKSISPSLQWDIEMFHFRD